MATRSPALAYAELLAGGVVLYAAVKGASLSDVLAGRNSPLRPLTSAIPDSFDAGAGGVGTSSLTSFATGAGGGTSAMPSGAGNAAQMIRWAKAVVGTQEGSGRQARWAREAGVAATAPWCSVFIAAGLRRMGVAAPSNPGYSGTWLEGWSGGTNLHTTNLRKARPGDLIIFDWGDGGITDHVALYIGNGKVIGGNQSNEVSIASVERGAIVGIVRPHYPKARRRGRTGRAPRRVKA
jgi:cell wall-associated NlpC family hydrolase